MEADIRTRLRRNVDIAFSERYVCAFSVTKRRKVGHLVAICDHALELNTNDKLIKINSALNIANWNLKIPNSKHSISSISSRTAEQSSSNCGKQ